jgi:uncharacterized membrane protein
MRFILAAAVAAVFSAPAPAQEPAAPAKDEVSFSKQIMPIFKARCMECHDAKKKKGKLEMTSHDTLMKTGKKGPTIVAGDPDKSKLVASISGDMPDMPEDADPLKKEEIALIVKWIKEGAKNN